MVVFSDSFTEFLETLLLFFQCRQPSYSLISGHRTHVYCVSVCTEFKYSSHRIPSFVLYKILDKYVEKYVGNIFNIYIYVDIFCIPNSSSNFSVFCIAPPPVLIGCLPPFRCDHPFFLSYLTLFR